MSAGGSVGGDDDGAPIAENGERRQSSRHRRHEIVARRRRREHRAEGRLEKRAEERPQPALDLAREPPRVQPEKVVVRSGDALHLREGFGTRFREQPGAEGDREHTRASTGIERTDSGVMALEKPEEGGVALGADERGEGATLGALPFVGEPHRIATLPNEVVGEPGIEAGRPGTARSRDIAAGEDDLAQDIGNRAGGDVRIGPRDVRSRKQPVGIDLKDVAILREDGIRGAIDQARTVLVRVEDVVQIAKGEPGIREQAVRGDQSREVGGGERPRRRRERIRGLGEIDEERRQRAGRQPGRVQRVPAGDRARPREQRPRPAVGVAGEPVQRSPPPGIVEGTEERLIDAEGQERQVRRRGARRQHEVVDDVAKDVVNGRRAASEEEDAAGGGGTGKGETAAETAAEQEGDGERFHRGNLTHRVRADSPPKRVSARRNA